MHTPSPTPNHIEYEIALDISQTTPEHVRSWLLNQPDCTYQRTTHLYNLYYDTPQHTLKQHKSALRLRYDSQAQTWIQTLKTSPTQPNLPNAAHTPNPRQEWETIIPNPSNLSNTYNSTNQTNAPSPISNAKSTHAPQLEPTPPNWRFDLFPTEARALLQPIKDQLQPLFHTNFTREIYHQQPSPTETYEWAIDTGHIQPYHPYQSTNPTTATPNPSIIIQELEIELKHGTPATLQHLANQASQTLNAPTQTQSKAARGYQCCDLGNTP